MKKLEFNSDIYTRFISETKERFPKKTFGYFLSAEKQGNPTDFVIFEEDIRDAWKDTFEEYGNYYKRNEDAGFLASPEETWEIEKRIMKKKQHKVGVFHSHQRHPPIFSRVDVDLHPEPNLWHLIIALKNIEMPQIKIFKFEGTKIKELSFNVVNI